MKALVGAFNQEGEGPSRGLLRHCTTSPMDRFAALIICVLVCGQVWVEHLVPGGQEGGAGAEAGGGGRGGHPAQTSLCAR